MHNVTEHKTAIMGTQHTDVTEQKIMGGKKEKKKKKKQQQLSLWSLLKDNSFTN
jgi:hypothetical protein